MADGRPQHKQETERDAHTEAEHEQTLDRDGFVAQVLSWSWVANLAEEVGWPCSPTSVRWSRRLTRSSSPTARTCT